jgi:hypothetical protein
MQLLSASDIAKKLATIPVVVHEMLRRGEIPPPLTRIGDYLRWDQEVIDSWIRDGCPKNQSVETSSTS